MLLLKNKNFKATSDRALGVSLGASAIWGAAILFFSTLGYSAPTAESNSTNALGFKSFESPWQRQQASLPLGPFDPGFYVLGSVPGVSEETWVSGPWNQSLELTRAGENPLSEPGSAPLSDRRLIDPGAPFGSSSFGNLTPEIFSVGSALSL